MPIIIPKSREKIVDNPSLNCVLLIVYTCVLDTMDEQQIRENIENKKLGRDMRFLLW